MLGLDWCRGVPILVTPAPTVRHLTSASYKHVLPFCHCVAGEWQSCVIESITWSSKFHGVMVGLAVEYGILQMHVHE